MYFGRFSPKFEVEVLMLRNQMTWTRFITLFVGLGLWFVCFFTFLFRTWKKRNRDGKDAAA